MKLIDLVNIRNIFKPDMKFKDIQVGYKVMKFLKSIENDTNFYDTKLVEIAKECAEKDGDNIKTNNEGNIVLAKDKVEDWDRKLKDLANVEIEISLPSFKIEDFSECNFNLRELNILGALISE